MKQSGGSIWADSEPGKGTTFTLLFPAEVAVASTGPRTAAAPARRLPAGTETILLVEDDGAVRRIAGRILRQLGYDVVVARDGVEAVDTFNRLLAGEGDSPDLVLTDVVMPDLPGDELVRRLRQTRPGLRAIYMSGYAEKRGLARQDGADRAWFIQKPFTHEELATLVRTALD